jgi:DNA-binding beta-propeller fold protein YncE
MIPLASRRTGRSPLEMEPATGVWRVQEPHVIEVHVRAEAATHSTPVGSRLPPCRLRPLTLVAAVVFALAAGLLFSAPPASAFTEYQNVSSFGTSTLSFPQRITVDQINGDVLVADGGTGRVRRFTPVNRSNPSEGYSSGASIPMTFASPSGIAVDTSEGESQGDIYVSDQGVEANTVYKFLPSGEPDPTTPSFGSGATPVSLSGPTGVAVDPANGNVYVADGSRNEIDIYTSSGEFIDQFEIEGPSDLAFDSTGAHLYVEDENTETVKEVDAAGTPVLQTDGPNAGTDVVDDSGVATAVVVNPTNGTVYVATRFDQRVDLYGPSGATLEPPVISTPFYFTFGIAVDGATGTVFIDNLECCSGPGTVYAYKAILLPNVTSGPPTSTGQTFGTLTGNLDPAGNGPVTACYFEYGTDTSYGHIIGCSPEAPYAGPTDVSAELSGLSTETTYHYRLVAENANGAHAGLDETFVPHAVGGLASGPASEIAATTAKLNGSFIGNKEDTHYYFEWGPTASYGTKTAGPPGVDAGSPSGPEPTQLSFTLENLEPLSTYHYRLVASNSAGTTYGEDQSFSTLASAPLIASEFVTDVHSDSALLQLGINPAREDTTYHIEYGPDMSYGARVPVSDVDIGAGATEVTERVQLTGLTAGSTYHWRVVASNATGTTDGPDHTFTTFPSGGVINDSCSNAHVRQQTSAALLLDCRAYELVSAPNTGGYDVESDLVAGQTPFGGYPEASSPPRVLYAVHDGGIPGTGHPTNFGPDPYVATRTEHGWVTSYAGIPSNGTPSTSPFASTLAEADPNLDTFAFAGANLCSPCFEGGGTGIPMHMPDGSLVQGMAGSLDPGPSAKQDGYIGHYFSADGSHFIFGSTSQFEPDGNNNGDVSIYDRNLKTGETHVVSKTPGEANLPCLQGSGECHSPSDGNGISELDISNNGSHILLGQKVATDADGNVYWHLYMNVGDSNHTVDLTPGATDGVLYDGMTKDGSKVFFTTSDKLLAADTDSSADIYQAEVAENGSVALQLISTGTEGAGNSDSCDPAPNSVRPHWNSVGSAANCDVLAIGGGGGIGVSSGTIYFLSPEKLDGSSNGVQNAPNLYVARPGSASHFIATLESILSDPNPPRTGHAFQRYVGNVIKPKSVAVDQSNHDVYVVDPSNLRIEKFDASGKFIFMYGKEVNKTKVESHGTETEQDVCTAASGDVCQPGTQGTAPGEFSAPASIAVDNSNAASKGDVYVGDTGDNMISKFDSSGSLINSWRSGGQFDGSTDEYGPFHSIGGIAVDTAGRLIVDDPKNNRGHCEPGGCIFVFGQDGGALADFVTGVNTAPVGIAVDSANRIYVPIDPTRDAQAGVEVFSEGGANLGRIATGIHASGLAADQSNGEVYVDDGGSVIQRYDSSCVPNGTCTPAESFGSLQLRGGAGLAVDGESGAVFAANSGSGNVAAFPFGTVPDPTIDNPAVVDAVGEAETHHFADFQVSPNGNFAVFTSTLSLTGNADNAGHSEVYRYDAATEALDCVSCDPTGARAQGDATLASKGLSLTDDGRVFFNSTDALAPRDLDEREDAYEWENGTVQLISTGASPFASSLLGVSANGVDAYFFTHDTLVPQDENGPLVKIYDARELGGFPYIPPSPQCAASDECHGPGSPRAPLPDLHSNTSGGAANTVPGPICKAGFVERHGKCVMKPHKPKHHRRRRRHMKRRQG